MAYYFYLQHPNFPITMFPDQVQGFSLQNNDHSFYSTQNIFLTTNFNTAPLNFTQFPCYFSQQQFVVPSTYSLPQINTQVPQPKQHKKRQRNTQKQIQSAKKNSESNLINHFFSYFNNRQKSQKTIESCIGSITKTQTQKQKLLHLFYNTIHVINARRGRKYVNRKNLIALFEPQQLLASVPEIKQKIQKLNQISVEQLCQIFRRSCFSFYRSYSIDSILTSKRITCLAKQQHFRKRRKVLKAFNDKQ